MKKLFLLLLPASLLLVAVLLGTRQVQGGLVPVDGPIVYQRTREQLVAMYPGFFFYVGPSDAKKVALTFDDGPDEQITPQILNILKENSVRATFFLVGKNARQHPDMVRRIAAEGHIIANHTWSHPNMANLNQEQVRREIEKTDDLLEHLTGHRAALLRVPWGAVSDNMMGLVQKGGYRVIGWSADSFDWRDSAAWRVLANLHAQIHPGAIILMHAVGFHHTGPVTPKVLPQLIRDLKEQGYQCLTVDELLKIPAYRSA